MPASESIHARRAALLLHTLPPTQRAQVISRLDGVESARVQPLLDELNQLGVTAEFAARLRAQMDETLPAHQQSDLLRRTDALDPAAVAQCLDSCGNHTLAELLHAHSWSWKKFVLDRIHGPRRFAVLQSMHDVTAPAPAVLESLCRQLCAGVAGLTADGAGDGAPGSGRGSRVRLRLLRWLPWRA
jgi:hypothetical protein